MSAETLPLATASSPLLDESRRPEQGSDATSDSVDTIQHVAAGDGDENATDVSENKSTGDGDDQPPASCCCSLPRFASPNVVRTIAFSFLSCLSGAVWQMSVWAPFLKFAFHSNISLGIVAAASGVGELLAATASGWGADRFGKELFLRLAAATSVVSVAAVAVGVQFEHLGTLIAASALSGASYGAFFPVVEAIFADSVPAGARTAVYNVKFGLETFAFVLGYIVSMALFAGLGDHWHLPTMRIVIWSGLGLQLVATSLLFTIREKHTLKAMAKAAAAAAAVNVNVNAEATDDDNASDENEDDKKDEEQQEEDPRRAAWLERALAHAPGLLPQRRVPLIVAIKDVITCLGSGMTIMYMSLFLIDDYGVSPVALQGVFLANSATSIVFSQAIGAVVGDSGACKTESGKPRFNRLRVMVVPMCVGVFGIFYLALARGSVLAAAAVVLPIYVVRSAAMNCLAGLSRAVLMDTVPESQRAKWNVFESVSSVTWSGSAIIGGAIADHWDYRATFLITAAFHAASLLTTATAWGNRDRPAEEIAEALVDAGVVDPYEPDADAAAATDAA